MPVNPRKKCIIVRGTSGSGKTHFAQYIQNICVLGGLRCIIASADQYFEQDGEYKFDHTKLHIAHERCQEKVDSAMYFKVDIIILANTSTQTKELAPYIKLAEKYKYEVTSIIMENRHGSKDIHDVPWVTLNNQAKNLYKSLQLLPPNLGPIDVSDISN